MAPWEDTTGSARKWWLAFEAEHESQPDIVLRMAEELANRKATITEFFLAYVYSNTKNLTANLLYLDYTRLKKEEERKKREAASKAREAKQQAARDRAKTPGSGSDELTFVRCPSCRSLVPAVSTRCRMCGAPLADNRAIATLGLSKRVVASLVSEGIETTGQLTTLSESKVRAVRGIGDVAMREILTALDARGLDLADESEGEGG